MTIQRSVSSLIIGGLFGLGLAVSGMTNPEKVLAFLNVVSNWDPSLVLVMTAAFGVAFLGFRWPSKSSPLFDSKFHLPTKRVIDGRLISGGIVFGIGWGLAGYCPGPAIAGLASGSIEPLIFIGAMLTGSQLARFFD